MAGGTFNKNTKKVRPGVYVNVQSTVNNTVFAGRRGTVLIPFVTHDYGPTGSMITLSGDSPDIFYELLGYSVYDTTNANMLLIREALKNAATVLLWIIKTGSRATASGGGLTGTAKYGGTRGNKLSFVISANVLDNAKFDITVSLDGNVVSKYTGIANITEAIAIDDPWIVFTKTANDSVLAVNSGVNLTGATAATASSEDVMTFLDSVENAGFDVILFPNTDSSLQTAFVSKVRFLNDNVGKNIQGVVAGKAADYQGVINVTNSYKTSDGITLTIPQAAAWVAGATAAAECTESLTYRPVDDAVEVVGVKSNETAISAISNGEFFFSYNEGTVVVESDVNSLVNVGNNQDASYKKNRVVRTINEVIKSIKAEFSPNKYANVDTHWDVMDEHGQAILSYYAELGAIKAVEDGDFSVDREMSSGEHTYFNVYIRPIDSAEKLYVTVYTG